MTEPTAPGWYEDPQDPQQLRYYDGIVWTAHTTPLTSPTAASSTIGHAPHVASEAERAAHPHGPAPSSWSGPPAWASSAKDTLPDGAVLAPWWRRLVARGLDWLLTSVVSGLLSIPFIGPLVTALEEYLADALRGGAPDQAAFQAAVLEASVPVTVIGLVVGLVYETGFLLWRAATPGKMALGTLVRPTRGPGPVSLVVAVRRQAITVLTALMGLNAVLGVLATMLSVLDPAWLLWDPRRQALHDKVADTVVVLKP